MNRDGDMTPQLMVLGLACVRAGTVPDLQRRLSELFAAAAFPKNSAHTNIPQLAVKGHVRLVDAERGVYEGTPPGLQRLRAWLASRPPAPASRETIHGKMEFAKSPEEVLGLLLAARDEANALLAARDEAHQQVIREQQRRLRHKARTREEQLGADLTAARLIDVKMMWDDMVVRRRQLADRIENAYRRYNQAG